MYHVNLNDWENLIAQNLDRVCESDLSRLVEKSHSMIFYLGTCKNLENFLDLVDGTVKYHEVYPRGI